MDKLELLAPVGSMANLKAAVSRKADSVYLGMRNFSARDFATNFNEKYLHEAVNICKSNNVKLYLTMNTLVKNEELDSFFKQLSFAYHQGIDAVIIQETSFLDLIKKTYPDLRVHISTQAGVLNSQHANLLSKADRINLARELTKEEIKYIKNNFKKELEIFCHGALCVSISGCCLFSSLIGGRSGNRGKCAQPCRKIYNNCYYLSTKELCLIDKIPDIISAGVSSIKIEGRMRTPSYVATTTEIYRNAIDSYYKGNFKVTQDMRNRLYNIFNREFTTGWFDSSKEIFNRLSATGKQFLEKREEYKVNSKEIKINRKNIQFQLPEFEEKSAKKQLLVRVYSMKDAIEASKAGADIVYLDLFDKEFDKTKVKNLYAITPRIMLDQDVEKIKLLIKEKSPDGILAGNQGILNLDLKLPIHLDYNNNIFNDISLDHSLKQGATPIISPELSLKDLKSFKNKNFIVLVHGKIRLMTLRHDIKQGTIKDQLGINFKINPIYNGVEILNEKELGLLNKSSQLLESGINNFFIDTDKNVKNIVTFYRNLLDNGKVNDSSLKKDYILGWYYRGIE